jgi:hypothetical protein
MLTPWFITGFCAGEAAFTYSRHGQGLGLYFAIKLNDSERELMGQIQEFFGVGKIYQVKARLPQKHSGFTKPALYYRVTKIEELERVIEHFDKFPLSGQKQKSYEIWKQMVFEKRRFRRPDNLKINELALELSKLSNKNTKIRRFIDVANG